jgi:hypothetical protein
VKHRTGTFRRAFAQPARYQFVVITENTWGLAGECGTLGSSLVLVNETLPQEVRLFKGLEGYFLIPSPYLTNSATNTIKIPGRTQVWALVKIDMSRLEEVTERVNITLPSRVLHIIDEAAKRAGESGKAFRYRGPRTWARCSWHTEAGGTLRD